MLGSQYSTAVIYKAIRYGQTNIPKGKAKEGTPQISMLGCLLTAEIEHTISPSFMLCKLSSTANLGQSPTSDEQITDKGVLYQEVAKILLSILKS